MITNSMYLTLWPARLDAGRPERPPFAEKLGDQSPAFDDASMLDRAAG